MPRVSRSFAACTRSPGGSDRRGRFSLDTLIALIFNGETAGGFRLARRSSLQDGHFECLLLEKRNFFYACWVMLRYLLGGNPKAIRHLHVRELEIHSPIDVLTDVDGQKGATFPFRFVASKTSCAYNVIAHNTPIHNP